MMSSSEKIIEFVRRNKCLYDRGDRYYRNVTYKLRLWEKIARELELTSIAVKGKWKTIRDGYIKYKKQVQGSTAQGRTDISYVWAEHLMFLDDTIQPRPTTSNITATQQQPQPDYPLRTSSEEIYTPVFNLFSDENREPKPKKTRQDNFSIVKKCCFNLVKKHGRSVTLFDDRAFRDLINLIPMTQSEKQTINSEYIQKLVDDDELGDDTDMEPTTEMTTDAAVDDDDDVPLQSIKREVEVVPCTCGKGTDETMTRHTVECPASSQHTYWNFFEVSLDSATCQICHTTLSYNIATLKEHLQNSHPSVDFIDDEDEFQKGPPSEDGSTNVFGMMEEVYLDENLSDSEHAPKSAKRRRKKARAPLNITGPISRENIAASLNRFQSLDCFGQYVASLMKLIPKDKCIKLQIQIVERLLQEQAAAG